VQPNVFPHVSPVVIANVVPMAPNRVATVTPDPTNPNGVRVTVAGSTRTNGPPSRIVVTPQLQPSPGLWVSLPDFALGRQGPATDSAQSGSVRLPGAPGSRPMRLLIREFETLPTDIGSQDRLIYVESIGI